MKNDSSSFAKTTTMEPITITHTNRWTFVQKILFRVFFVYFVLYCFPFPLDAFEFTKPFAEPFYHLLDWLIALLGKYVFDIAVSMDAFMEKTPDNSYGLVYMAFFLPLSLLVTLIWTAFDGNRLNYNKLKQWFQLYLRFYLAMTMFWYGFMKVYPLQRIPISVSQLDLPYGMQLPITMIWHFLGYSETFTRFAGWAEVVGASLLLWRRTVTLGALVLTGVLATVVVVNFCYGVYVKFYSSHLLVISLILLLEDGKRLLNVLILNKATQPVSYTPFFKKTIWRRTFSILLLALIACMYYKLASENSWSYAKEISKARPLKGIYQVEYFIRNKDTLPRLQIDSLRWKKLIIDLDYSAVYLGNDSVKYCQTLVDTVYKEIRFQFKTNNHWWNRDFNDSCLLAYSLPDSGHLFLNGIWNKDSIQLMMKNYDLNNYPLYREKFKWIIGLPD